jgi:uncharacterized glyoxalase superfamily protein PhnB
VTAGPCACCGEPAGTDAVALLHAREVTICSRCLDWLVAQRDKHVAARGGAVRLIAYDPCFGVADVARAAAHYELLGFDISYHDDTYAFADRGGLTIHLGLREGEAAPQLGVVYLHVDDADQLAADWRKAGLEVSGPENYEWGKREGTHTDPDGNVLRFGSGLPSPSD